jgi:hypothetical protein
MIVRSGMPFNVSEPSIGKSKPWNSWQNSHSGRREAGAGVFLPSEDCIFLPGTQPEPDLPVERRNLRPAKRTSVALSRDL